MTGRRARLLRAPFAAVILVWGACGKDNAPPRIVYPAPWLGPGVADVARQAMEAQGRGAVVIVDSLSEQLDVPPGLGREVDYAERMARLPGVVVAIGPQSSRATLLSARIFADRGIPLIVPTATSHHVRDLGPWVFQLAPDDRAEGEFMARFIVDRLAAHRVTVFFLVADEYGLGLRDGLVEALARRGVAPVDQVGIVEETDFPRRVDESLERATPNVVAIAARGPEAAVVVRAIHQRLPSVPLVGGDGVALDTTFIRMAGAAAESMYAVAWWSRNQPDTLSRAFVARYERDTGEPPSASVAMYYNAIMLAARAVRAVGPNRKAIRRYLRELGRSRPAYRGVTGRISFGPDRMDNLVMTRLEHGRVVVVYPEGRP